MAKHFSGALQHLFIKQGKKKLWLAATAVVAAVAVAAFSSGSLAKYVHQSDRNGMVRAQEFYFTSDYLKPVSGVPTEYTLNPNVTEISFELRNYEGLKVSELDINYTVTVTGGAVASAAGGTVQVTESADVITLSNLQPGNSYTVTVTGTNGYEKSLTAIFTVSPSNTGVYKNTTEYGEYVILTVWTQNITGTVTITVPTGMLPDSTDPDLTGKDVGDVLTLTLEQNQSRAYRFFVQSGYVSGTKVPVVYDSTPLEESALG